MTTEEPTIFALRMEAAVRGENKFQHPTACRTCQSHWRYVASNQCVDCTKERASRNSAKMREALRAAKRKG